MSRPKRAAAAQNAKSNVDDKEDIDLSEESSGDFSSASSDEYDPRKDKEIEDTFEESEDPQTEDEEEETSFSESPVKKRKSSANRSVLSTLRVQPVNKFKRSSTDGGSRNLQDILQRSQYQKKKSIFDESAKEKIPEFDCSGGLRLSESESDDDGPTTSAKALVKEKKKTLKVTDSINEASSSSMNLKNLHDNLQLIEQAKSNMMKYQSAKGTSGCQKENVNIAELLALGEDAFPQSSVSNSKLSEKRLRNDSESDDGWEEVEDEGTNDYKAPKDGVEIVINDFNGQGSKKEAKIVDLEAQLKRKINRKRKEHQQHLHKVNLISWVEHYAFVNRKLNDKNLMSEALKLLPKNKNHCYPRDETDLDYFKQITKWFKTTIGLRNQTMYCEMRQRPPLMTSLALQMKFKTAICQRDYVLIFIILLRAIGVQCRMVQNVVLAPFFPPKSELISLAAVKKTDEKSKKSVHNEKSVPTTKSNSNSKSSSKSKSSSNSKSKAKNNTGDIKIPQLDGNDDDLSEKKPSKSIRIKLAGYEATEESFVDINKIETPGTPKNIHKRSQLSSQTVTNLTPKVSVSLDSPNRIVNSPSEKLFKSKSRNKQMGLVKRLGQSGETFSPLKTRSMRKDNAATAVTSKVKSTIKKDSLQVVSPRRLRSRSRSNDKGPVISSQKPNIKKIATSENKNQNKPNLRSLSNTQATKRPSSAKSDNATKKMKVTSTNEKISVNKTQNEIPKKKAKLAEEVQDKTDLDPEYTSLSESERNIKKSSLKKKLKKRLSKTKNEIPKKKTKLAEEDEIKTDSDPEYTSLSESEKIFTKTSLKKTVKKRLSKLIDRRVLSTDTEAENAPRKSKGIDIWVELYAEKEKRWIAIDVLKQKIDKVKEITKTASHPIVYVFAFNNDQSLKDVSARYCPNLCTTVRKMRVDDKYLTSVISRYEGIKTSRDVKEDDELNSLLLEKPMPTSIALFKNHPLYALKRHLLKYEAIYPPEPPILGYIRDEAIYPRETVFVLHTRETWLKEARVVKINEKPYKMTKTLKWDTINRKLLRDIPQELFGVWQTKDFEPPVAENGMVPRNAYGNVELFKPCMLPKGCVHLQLPGLNKVCKKIGVDCSQAIVGFDSNGGWPFPVYDGFIICEEFQEKVIDAWNREQEALEVKENEKFEKRVYGNWKKLIKGLLIRQRLKNKYNFEGINAANE